MQPLSVRELDLKSYHPIMTVSETKFQGLDPSRNSIVNWLRSQYT